MKQALLPEQRLLNHAGEIEVFNDVGNAHLIIDGQSTAFRGHWVTGKPWERFGLYNSYVVIRQDGEVLLLPAHAGELVPGSTEDLTSYLQQFRTAAEHPSSPMTLELDPTYQCTSKDCGTRCFSAAYRKLAPNATIATPILRDLIQDFALGGGRIIRFDGGGDPLSHPAVRNGELPELAHELSLKSTILTSGDLLSHSDLHRIGRADCYMRISLNAATDETRHRFHGNRVSLNTIFNTIEEFAGWLQRENPSLPIGATFLIDTLNYREVLDCATRARNIGISHFSVRRVLGPVALRPSFSKKDIAEINDLLAKVRELAIDQFRVFVPWRPINEPDIEPADFHVGRCWQSTLKTVVEPDPLNGGFRAQLCGRYRGSGVGQLMQMPPLLSSSQGLGWTEKWQHTFEEYGVSRSALPGTCNSCIDRGFILLIDRLLNFLKDHMKDFQILHLYSSDLQDKSVFFTGTD